MIDKKQLVEMRGLLYLFLQELYQSNSLRFCLRSDKVSYCGPFSSWRCNVHSSWGIVPPYFGMHHGWTTESYSSTCTCSGSYSQPRHSFSVRQPATYLPSTISLSGLPYKRFVKIQLSIIKELLDPDNNSGMLQLMDYVLVSCLC